MSSSRTCNACVLVFIVQGVLNICSSTPLDSSQECGPLNLSFSKMAVFNEDSCLREGGQCLQAADCPEGKLTEQRGLCPEQQKWGVECCFGVSEKITDCQGLGGLCRSDCNSNLIIKEAKDCTGTDVCCVLGN